MLPGQDWPANRQDVCSPTPPLTHKRQCQCMPCTRPAALRPAPIQKAALLLPARPTAGGRGLAHTLVRQARWRLPRCAVLRCALTLAAVHLMAHHLLFPVLLGSGVPARVWEQLWPAGLLDGVCGAGAGVTASK